MPKLQVEEILDNPRSLFDSEDSLIQNAETLKSLSSEQQKEMASKLVIGAGARELNSIARTIGRAFGGLEMSALSKTLNNAIAAKAQILSIIEDPADTLLDQAFDIGLVHEFWDIFCAGMEGQVDVVAEKIYKSDQLGKIKSVLEQMNPDALDKENPVSQLQAAVNKQMAGNRRDSFFQPEKAEGEKEKGCLPCAIL